MSKEIIEYIEKFMPFMDRMSNKKYPYTSHYDFILKNGKTCKPQIFNGDDFIDVPTTPKECFRNAWYLSDMYNLIYMEGLAYNNIVTEHAWCIDKDFNVYDPTWPTPETGQYFGVPFNKAYTEKKIMDTEHFGIMGNHIQNHPLVTGKDKDFLWIPSSYL